MSEFILFIYNMVFPLTHKHYYGGGWNNGFYLAILS